MKYKHLSLEERHYIAIELKKSTSIKKISKALDRPQSVGIPNRTDIDERPEIINNRERVGDWERDLIIGKNHKGGDRSKFCVSIP